MKKCKCNDWKENMGILDSALMLHFTHGFSKGLKKSFSYCPYCGEELQEDKKLPKKKKKKKYLAGGKIESIDWRTIKR